jgi:hypothetical protein
MKNSNDTIWDRTSDLLICSTLTTVLPRSPTRDTDELISQTHAHLLTVGDKGHKVVPTVHQTLYHKDVLVSGGMAPCILNHALHEL